MRVGEKSAEAVVARKAGNAAGAKGRRTKERKLERELGDRRKARSRIPGATTTVANPGALGEEAVQPRTAYGGETMPDSCEPSDGEQCTRG